MNDATRDPIGADAWMDPDTRDVINAERKQSWLDDYGIGGRAKAATYTVPLVRAALASAARPAAAPAAVAGPSDPQLLKFYGVATDSELIAAQAAHIERLQAKRHQTPTLAPQRAREG